MDIQTISTIVGVLIGLGALAAGLGFAYAQFKSGGDKYKDNLIETLKATAEAETTERRRLAEEKTRLLELHSKQLNEQASQLAEIRGRLDEQVKKAEEYKALLLGRDPKIQKTLTKIEKYLETLIRQSKTNQIRNEEIDSDTKAKAGNVMRKEA